MLSNTIKSIRAAAGAVSLLIPLLSVAQQGPPPLATSDEIKAIQSEARRAGITLQGVVGARDAQGNLLVSEDGMVQSTKQSSSTQFNDLEYFKSITGITGLEQKSSPGRGKEGRVNLEVEQFFDFKCSNPLWNIEATANGLSFIVKSCSGLAPVHSVEALICDAHSSSSQCIDEVNDYRVHSSLQNGAYTRIGSKQVGLGCTPSGDCRITVKGVHNVGGSDATLGKEAAQLNARSQISGAIQTSVLDGRYAQQMETAGGALLKCAERNRLSSSTNGTVSGCSDDASDSILTIKQATQSDAQCSGAKECKRWETSKQSFTRTCTRTIPLTERITSYKYDTLTCTRTQWHASKTKSAYYTNSCDRNPDPRSGMVLIGTDASYCSAYSEPESENDPVVCIATSWPQYYTSASPEVIGVEDSPSPVIGACEPASGDTQFTTFEGGHWFGRILPSHECSVSFVDELDDSPVDQYMPLTFREKAGCGVYTRPKSGVACYGRSHEADSSDSCADMDLSQCTLVSSTPTARTGGDVGLVMAQTDLFQCVRSKDICQEWSYGSGDSSCLSVSDMTFGTDKVGSAFNNGAGLNEALVATEIINATAEGLDANKNPFIPLLFSGRDMRCTRATGGIGQLVGRNCCKLNLERPIKGNIIRGGCKMPAVELAAARRSNYTVYIGEYCSKKLKFPKRCIQRTETYCAFNGILPRLLHEQGRTQLANIVKNSTGSDVQRAPMSYEYLDAGDGSWTPVINVNGVQLSAWKWPNYCKTQEAYAERLMNDPYANECPSVVHTVIASCDNGVCGELPESPDYGSTGWNLVNVDSDKAISTAISKYAVVSGQCSAGLCSFEASSWPAGKGGKAIISRDISWPLYAEEQASQEMAAGGVSQMTNMSDLIFRTWSASGMSDGKTMPSTVRVDYSNDGGQRWRTIQVPTSDTGREFEFPGTDIKMHGRCEATTNFCAFRVTGTLSIQAKPWGSAKHPDCTGFTGGQLSAMDFSKMDLSEWLAEVMETVSDAVPAGIGDAASAQFSKFNSMFQDGQGSVSMAAPTAANYARVTPSQGFGPFNVRVIAGGFWPQTTGDPSVDVDAVYRVDVNWGDCTPKETLMKDEPTNPASAFIGYHRFEAPDALKCGAKKANVTQEITLTIYTTKSGSHTRHLSVENAWSVFPGGSGKNNDNVEIRVEAPVNQGLPTHPSSTLRNH